MVTIEESIPKKSSAFLKGIDIFYTQFNDINFYIEDENQENFYHEIFLKLFPKIRLSKIFPLRGKENVVTKAKKHQGDKKKIFLVDKDFDDLLGIKLDMPNLFYLNRYSIENFLIEENSFKKYVIEEKPRIRPKSITDNFKFKEFLQSAVEIFQELTIMHLLVQYKGLNIQNTSYPPERFLQFGNLISLKNHEINRYKADIQNSLSSQDKRMKVDPQIKKIKSKFNLYNCKNILCHIPGKYLILYFKSKLEHLFNIASRNVDSFIYRLAKLNDFNSLNYLKLAINKYVK